MSAPNPLKELMARKAAENAQKAKSAQGVSVAEQRNIETGAASSVPGKFATLRSYPVSTEKELDFPRAQAAIAVYEDIKLRHIQRGRGRMFAAENGYFYVENDFDAQLIAGYANKSIPVIRLVEKEFIEAEIVKRDEEAKTKNEGA